MWQYPGHRCPSGGDRMGGATARQTGPQQQNSAAHFPLIGRILECFLFYYFMVLLVIPNWFVPAIAIGIRVICTSSIRARRQSSHRCLVHGCLVHGCLVHGCLVHGCLVHGCLVHGCRSMGVRSMGVWSMGVWSMGVRSMGAGPWVSGPWVRVHGCRSMGEG